MKLLTVDTNVLINRIKREGDYAAAQCLLSLDAQGDIEIKVTSRIKIDVPHETLHSQIMALAVVARGPIGSSFTIGFSAVEGDDMIADNEIAEMGNALMRLLFPASDPTNPKHMNRIADVDHLIAHHMAKREIFITEDRGILERQTMLSERFGLTVMSPMEFLNQHFNR